MRNTSIRNESGEGEEGILGLLQSWKGYKGYIMNNTFIATIKLFDNKFDHLDEMHEFLEIARTDSIKNRKLEWLEFVIKPFPRDPWLVQLV